jgi:hypothetical protein
MAFRDFSIRGATDRLRVEIVEADLVSSIAPVILRDEIVQQVRAGVEVALAVNTGKARSEFILALVLLELKRSAPSSFGLFSGIELNVDPNRGLDGTCDFILTKSRMQLILTAPLLTVVGCENDNVHDGLGRCVAQMFAAWEFNRLANAPADVVHGVVTTGTAWKFLQMRKTEVSIDIHEYYIVDLSKIMGILTHMIPYPR